MKLIDWARRYRDELDFSVIPIPKGEKGPKIHWEQYQKRKPTDQELEDWFSDDDSNIGVVCGEVSNLAVLDFDTPELYAKFFSKHEELEKNTLVVRTGGGGYHVYLRVDEPVQSRKFMEPRLDLKAEGGQVVAPPSIHPSGTEYELISEKMQIMGVSADELNAFIKEKIPREEKLGGKMPRRKKEPYRGEDPACVEKALEGVKEGYRNETAFRLACYWRNTRLLKRRTVLKRLNKWNEDENKPPLPGRELARTFNSADKGDYQFGCPGMQEFCTEECPFLETERTEEAERTEEELSEREPTTVGEIEAKVKRTVAAEEPVNLPIDLHPLLGPVISFRMENKNVFLGENGLIGASSSEIEIKEENATYSIPIRGVDWVSIERLTMLQFFRLFLEARKTGKMPKTPKSEEFFKRVYDKIKYYWDHSLEPRWRVAAALWIIGTYFHRVFDFYPIVILQGERESGKTTLLFVVKAFGWNPTPPSTALRPAPMFRKIDTSRPTFLVDITKLWGSEKTDVIDVCEAGLERGGTVSRCVGENNEVREFEAYSPKMIATRSSLPFEAKAIKIVTCKPRNKERFKDLANRRDLELPNDADRGDLKKQGILCFLKYWREVKEAEESIGQTGDLYGRRFRLWRPILTICKVFSPHRFEDILDLAEKDARESRPSDYIYEVENAVIACTLDERSVLLKELTESVRNYLGDSKIRWQTVKSAMVNLGCIKNSRDTRGGKKFYLRGDVIHRLAQSRGMVEKRKKEKKKSSLEDYTEPKLSVLDLADSEESALEPGVDSCPRVFDIKKRLWKAFGVRPFKQSELFKHFSENELERVNNVILKMKENGEIRLVPMESGATVWELTPKE